jgi:hypothetical protein
VIIRGLAEDMKAALISVWLAFLLVINADICIALEYSLQDKNTGARSREAHAAEFKALTHQLVIGRCHMNSCWWFSIEAAAVTLSCVAGALS